MYVNTHLVIIYVNERLLSLQSKKVKIYMFPALQVCPDKLRLLLVVGCWIPWQPTPSRTSTSTQHEPRGRVHEVHHHETSSHCHFFTPCSFLTSKAVKKLSLLCFVDKHKALCVFVLVCVHVMYIKLEQRKMLGLSLYVSFLCVCFIAQGCSYLHGIYIWIEASPGNKLDCLFTRSFND